MIKGFDLSSWQDNNSTPQRVDWGKAVSQESKFCFIRAFYSTVIDEDFLYNWEQSKGMIIRGAYQFYDYRYPVRPQAEAFCKLMDTVGWGELPPVIDVETVHERKDGKSVPVPFPAPNAYQLAVQTWLKIVEAESGMHPIIYTGQNVIKYGLRISSTSPLTKYPLWIAEYRTPTGEPNYTPWPGWVFWQYGTPPVGYQYGMESRELDCNLYNGTLEELVTFANLPQAPKPELSDKEKLDWLWKKYGIPA